MVDITDKMANDSTVAARVIEQLRDDIINRRIDVGSRITIKEMAEKYGVSNMPVREAFRKLEGEKLLEINAYKGATVLPIDDVFIRNIYGISRALENLLYENALPHIDEALIYELETINELIGCLGAAPQKNTRRMELNKEFHGLVLSRGCNERALELYDYYSMLIRELRKSYLPCVERAQASYEEHLALIEAFRSKDLIKVKDATDTHITHAMEDFLKVKQQD